MNNMNGSYSTNYFANRGKFRFKAFPDFYEFTLNINFVICLTIPKMAIFVKNFKKSYKG